MSSIQNKPLALALLAFAQLIIAIDYTIVFVAVPDIGRELGFAAHNLQWVVSGYTVAFGGTVGLAVLVAIANRGVDGLAGDTFRTTATHGIRIAVLVTAAGIVLTAVLALTGHKAPAPSPVDAVSN